MAKHRLEQSEQDELTALLRAVFSFAERISITDQRRVKIQLNASHDASQLKAVLSNYPALVQRGNGDVLFIHYGERNAADVAGIIALVSDERG